MMTRLKHRAEFKRAAKGMRSSQEAFTVQAVRRGDDGPPRVGFTVTKKTGNAVVRNRIRRRLRALCETARDAFAPGTDYVIVARRAALDAPFTRLGDDLDAALAAARAKLERDVRKRA